jgi:hypothetical protein
MNPIPYNMSAIFAKRSEPISKTSGLTCVARSIIADDDELVMDIAYTTSWDATLKVSGRSIGESIGEALR